MAADRIRYDVAEGGDRQGGCYHTDRRYACITDPIEACKIASECGRALTMIQPGREFAVTVVLVLGFLYTFLSASEDYSALLANNALSSNHSQERNRSLWASPSTYDILHVFTEFRFAG